MPSLIHAAPDRTRWRPPINTDTPSATADPVRIVLAEDNDDLRAIMPPLIDEVAPFHCAATTAYIDEVAPLIDRHGARIAILDIQLRGGSALARLPALRAQFPGTRFVIHSGHSNPELIRRAGADAYVLKSGDFDELIRVLHSLSQ